MKRNERIAITRVIADLIKADNIIDVGEMEMYDRLREKYCITRDVECAAVKMTLAEAVQILKDSDDKTIMSFFAECKQMTVSDGCCVPQEASLIIALSECFDRLSIADAEIISAYEPDLKIGERQVIYVEDKQNARYNDEIESQYRIIANELRLAGFDFVYIPAVAKHYKEYNDSTFSKVVDFLAPYLSDEDRARLRYNLSNITTVQFVREQLIGRLKMFCLRDANPALLIKVGADYVGNRLYGNFLRVDIKDSVLSTIQRIMDDYVGTISTDKTVVNHAVESKGQFLYHGFYKQIFDMYTIRQGVEGSLEINPYRGDLLIPEIGVTLQGLQRKHKSLYVLLLVESMHGGIVFNPPITAKQMDKHLKNVEHLMRKFNKIYELFGGEKDAAPDIFQNEIRRPMISIIRKSVGEIGGEIRNAADFNIEKTEDGLFRIPLSERKVKILTTNGFVLLKDLKI